MSVNAPFDNNTLDKNTAKKNTTRKNLLNNRQLKKGLRKTVAFAPLNHLSQNQEPVRHFFPLLWLLLASFAVFGLYITWQLGFLHMVYEQDRSYLTSVIALLTTVASAHALWHILKANTLLYTMQDRAILVTGEAADAAGSHTEKLTIDQITEAQTEIVADRLRAPVELGWFLVDLAIRLGLAGTIIGFILIFTSLSGEAIVGENALRELLVNMSAGMGTALFTTLTGLIAATFLSFQYLTLGRLTEHLISEVVIDGFNSSGYIQPPGTNLESPAENPTSLTSPGGSTHKPGVEPRQA